MPLIFESYGYSDIGKTRNKNEDIIATLPSHNFFAIADGMGGHQAGEIAAKEATSEVCQSITKLLNPKEETFSQDQIVNHLKLAITEANKKVFSLGQNNLKFKGMGTTLCCLYLYNNTVTYAHVGDSRIYLFRNKKLKQLTKDHSLAHELKSSNKTEKNKNISPYYKNIITKAIGTTEIIKPEINFETFYPKDLYFMCTDGLSDFLLKDEIVDILKNLKSKKSAVEKLIDIAKKNGSRDNISLLLIEIL